MNSVQYYLAALLMCFSISIYAEKQSSVVIGISPDIVTERASVPSTIYRALKQCGNHKFSTIFAGLRTGLRIWRNNEANGTANILNKVAQELEAGNYCKLSEEQRRQLLEITVSPTVKQAEVAFVRELSKKHPLIMTTNMDTEHFKVFAQKVPEIVALFNVAVTAPYYPDLERQANKEDYYQTGPNTYAASAPYPAVQYLATAAAVAQKHGGSLVLVRSQKDINKLTEAQKADLKAHSIECITLQDLIKKQSK